MRAFNTPFPPNRENPYRMERDEQIDAVEYDDGKPVQSPQEVYESTPIPEDAEVERGSATGDDIELAHQGEDYNDLDREWDRNDEDFIRERELEATSPPESQNQTDADLKSAIEEEWFDWRTDTADLPNVIGGITKAQAFKRGWQPQQWRDFAYRLQKKKESAKRSKTAIRARNGFEVGWMPPRPQRPMSAAPMKYNVGDHVAGGIGAGYDFLGLNGTMAAAMKYDQQTQSSISNSVFGNLPMSSGKAYDVIGVGGAGGMPDLFGFGNAAPRKSGSSLATADPMQLIFGGISKSPTRKRKPLGNGRKKQAIKAKTNTQGMKASAKKQSVSKSKIKARQKPQNSKKTKTRGKSTR